MRLNRALNRPTIAKPLSVAPFKPMRSTSPCGEVTDVRLPPRHPPRDSIFTTEGYTEPEKPVARRSGHAEDAKQRARKVKTKQDLRNEVTRKQASTLSDNTESFKVPSNRSLGKPLSQKAGGDSTSKLASLPSHPPAEESSNASILQSKAKSGLKAMKQSLVLAPPPQPTRPYPDKHSELFAESNPNTRRELGHNPSPTYQDHNTPPHSPSRSPSVSHPAKRQALGEKPTNVWRRSGVECEQLPSLNSLFPSQHWENLCLKIPTTGPYRTARQDEHQIIIADRGAFPLDIYGRKDRPALLPPLQPRTPSIPSLNSSSAVSPTSPIAGRSRMAHPFTPSPHSVTHPDFAVRKSYSDGTLKPLPASHSDFGVRKRYSEGSLKFSPAACPWHAIRDVALARDRMNVPEEQIAHLLSHRYGHAYPFLREVTTEQVQELWESSRTCREALYTEQDCAVLEQELWNDLRSLGLV